ncbi:MAG TPA: family 20 glycosylhydrolase [Cellvibrio sp.]|nr:family 20 glycosylhydrolase [Cellvibrio sp.]
MIRYLLLIIIFSISACANLQAQAQPLPLMPWPQSVVQEQGQFHLGNKWLIAIDAKKNSEIKATVKRIVKRVEQQTGQKIQWRLVGVDKANLIIKANQVAPISNFIHEWDESYQLSVSASRVQVSANQSLGILRGLETFLQLIGNQQKIQLPLVNIQDQPRFKWRGLLLDTSRHFFSVNTIKRQIDAMAAAKYNIFHWHLTDDQGWRFESRKYPKLHKLASDGEYYSRKQIREIVSYARERGIQVLPEIDVPGHASAIAVAYPELMSAPGPYAMEYRWGVHKPLLNPANEKVYEFVDGLVAEVAELFPFEYLHIGGDEVDPEHWNTNPEIQAFMKENGLKDSRALQAHFNQRVQKILQQHQRKMIGWDEIQHKDLPNDIVIHSWRGPDGISDAVNHGFQAILSTGYYLDQPQYASYHYRNDPIPPQPVAVDKISTQDSISSWRFEIPRKRGKPVTGIFSLLGEGKNARVLVDFTGKSRREALLHYSHKQSARFSLDTWMGPVLFNADFFDKKLQGNVVVGNTPYAINGEKITNKFPRQNISNIANVSTTKQLKNNAQQLLPETEFVAQLSAKEEALILGGEAALWAEIVDEQSIDLRLWPRAFVVAERLWSARSLLDEHGMYQRLNLVADWAEKSVGLRHKYQQQISIKRLLGTQVSASEIHAMELFMQLLEPAHYYHRQHEKSAYESYSKADPLDRLVDALPVENDVLRQFDSQLEQWLKKPAIDAQHDALKTQLLMWGQNRPVLESILARQPQWKSLADNIDKLVSTAILLLDKRAQGKILSIAERENTEKMIQDLKKMDQEIIIGLINSIEKILYSFT